MKRQIITMLTLGSFMAFSFSCYSLKPIQLETLSSPDAGKIEIRKLDKTSGASIEYLRLDPGRVDGNFVVGTGKLVKNVEIFEIARDNLLKISQIPSRQGETFYLVETRDGKFYKAVKKIVEQEDTYVLYVIKDVDNKTKSKFHIALADVERVWIEEFDIIKTGSRIILFYGIAAVAAAVGLAVMLAAMFQMR